MKKLNIVIPVKNPSGAKERLASVLEPAQRTELALLLFDRVLTFFRTHAPETHILVVTDAESVAEQARRHGVTALVEEHATGETAAVEKATAWSMAHGYTSQLVVPGDMVDLDPDDLHALLALPRPDRSVIFCPATDDDGTNAILSTPPDCLGFRFGDRSFPDYCERAKSSGLSSTVLRLNSLVLDLDTPADLQALTTRYPNHPALELLRSWHVHTDS